MKQVVRAFPFLVLSACSQAGDVPADANLSEPNNPSFSQTADFDWVRTDETVSSLGERLQFPSVVASFLSDSKDPSSGPTLYDAWTGVGYSWLFPADVPNSPFRRVFSSSDGKIDWSKAALVRMTVGTGIPAVADTSTIERPWRVIVRADTKWVDTIVFEPDGGCYKAAGKSCENPTGESFAFSEALVLSGATMTPVNCSSGLLSAMQSLEVYELNMPGKKLQPVWVYSTGGSSGHVYSEFGVDFRDVQSNAERCEAIARQYE